MNELYSVSHNLERDTSPPSAAEHLNEVVKEIFGQVKNLKCDEKTVLAAAAIPATAFVGWRLGLPRLICKAGGELAEKSTARPWFEQGLEKGVLNRTFSPESLAQNSVCGELPKLNLSMSQFEPEFRYFQQSRGIGAEIFRFPANGKPLEQQTISDVERFTANGQWTRNQRENLINEYAKGWFHEKQDEITPVQAMAFLSRKAE